MFEVEAAKTDQAPAPAPAPAAEPSEIGRSEVGQALDRFAKDQAAEAAAKATAPAPSEAAKSEQGEAEPKGDGECQGCKKEKGKETAPEGPKQTFFVLDEKGNKVPLVFKADGKDYTPESLEKLMAWGSMGIHSNTFNESLKSREAEIMKAEGMVNDIIKAITDGKLVVKGKKLIPVAEGEEVALKTEGAEPNADDTDFFESEEAKQIKTLKEKLGKLEKDHEALSMASADQTFRAEKDKLDREISSHEKEFFLARNKDIWELLGVVENGKPKYDPRSAMEFLHKQEVALFDKHKREHPEIQDRKEIVADYLKEKSANERAPIQGPSETVTPSPTAKPKEYKSLHDALEAFGEDQKQALLARSKF